MNAVLQWTVKALASCFYLSYPMSRWRILPAYSHTGAGLVGTLFGLITINSIPADPLRAMLVVTGGILIAVAVSDAAEELLGVRDDPRIVIDEWIGFWCAAVLLPQTWPNLLAAFLLFRILDVTKPWFIRASCALPGGWGVVIDDVLAGLTANLLIRIAKSFIHS